MVDVAIQEVVDGESHGRLGMSAVLHGLDPIISIGGQAGLVLALITLVIVVVDIIMRGRMRATSLAFTHLLIGLAPVVAVYAASQVIIEEWLGHSGDSEPLSSFVVIEAAIALVYGSLVTGVGVVLTFLLKLDDAWRGRQTAKSDATTP